jgi:uncharacterized protein (TIGR02271 family)
VVASLVDLGIDEDTAGYYAEGIRRGGTLVVAQTSDSMNDRVLEIMNSYDPVDINQRASQWQSTGWTGFDAASSPYTADQTNTERQQYRTVDANDEARLQVVEEELQVGKREVERGKMRVNTYVTETPVEEQVTLREEHVSVERHPVNRPATEGDFATGQETIEVTEHAEQAVVSKQARVVEEVVVSKNVQERTETIHDTVRRKDVEVEQVDTGTTIGTRAFESFDNTFRTHYSQQYGSGGQPYNYYQPAYQYGYTLANNPRYRDYDWNRIESEARTQWESQNQGTWENIKDAVRNAWDSVRNAVD